MSAWRPVDTAPKNGGWVLVWAPGWAPVAAAWCHIPQIGAGPGWYVGDGKWIEPTHWQSMPDPPEAD